MAPALCVNGVSKTYARSESPALTPTSFDVEPGQFVSLVGPSGCGKSTLLGMIAGLITPDEGSIEALGEPVTGPGNGRAIVFQDAALFPWLTLERNVEYGLRAHGVPKAERREKVAHALRMVHLDHVAEKHPYELSGGMRQRASIARALVLEPEILLMDEPFSAVDALTRAILQELILKIWQTIPVTILFVTHDGEEAVFLSSRIISLTKSPAKIHEDVAIDLAYPRDQISTRADEKFHAQRQQLFASIFLQEKGGAPSAPRS